MIKLTLKVDDYFDKDDLIRALNANYAYSCIDDIKSLFRNINKHGYIGNVEFTEEQVKTISMLEKEFFSIIEDLPGRF